MKNIFKAVPAVYIILIKDEKALFGHRFNTGYQDGMYMTPGGHVEAGEPPTQAAAREAKEELNIEINPKDFELVHAMYRAAHDETGERVDYFFATPIWSGEPVINEPTKCDGLEWLPLKDLPETVVPYVKRAIQHWQKGRVYSELDWD